MSASRTTWSVALVLFLAAAVAMTVFACASSDDDDDDDDNANYGLDIEGLYSGIVKTTFNSCPTEPPSEEEWFLEIEQNDDFSMAEVFWREEGAGSEQALLFEGKVYGTAVVMNEIQENDIGEGDCVQVQLIDYRLNVDPENADVFGFLNDDTFYLGASCSASVVDCRTERVIEPDDAEFGDDDTTDDDDDTSASN
jgi:hypothetical protein